MAEDRRPVLVIGATGFVGRRVVAAITARGGAVRGMARDPAKAAGLAGPLVEVVQGDMLDAAAVQRALRGARAVVVCVHTITRQRTGDRRQDFMDVEAAGLRAITAACTEQGVRRVLYVTSLGVAERAASSWLRGRWRTEQALLGSGLDVTVVRPGMVVGRGGDGFGIVARGATGRLAVAVGSPRLRFRTVAVDDLALDIADLIDEPAAIGAVLDAGSDDVMTIRGMTAVAAASIGRRAGTTVFVPAAVVRRLAPLVERLARVPRGALAGLVGEGPQEDMVGDPGRLRALLGRSDRPFRQAIEGQVSAAAGAPALISSALWLDALGGKLHVRAAAVPEPRDDEVVVRARAVAVNPIDALPALARRIVLPWLRHPAVLGSDVAGEVVAVGADVTRFHVGDRVVGYAVGSERGRNSATEGAFRLHVALLEHLTAPLPSGTAFTDAVVLPLALTTAAAGLFEPGQLGLELPTSDPRPRGTTVLVLGGSTSVGLNAIQLARSAGYEVVATASPRNFPLLGGLGASACFDYHDADLVPQLVGHLTGSRMAGVLAVGAGSLTQALRLVEGTEWAAGERIASAYPTPVTAARAALARRRGVHVSAIWGGRPMRTAVGPAIWETYLPAALEDGRHVPAPAPLVVGAGLEAIPAALDRLRAGVSATKVVVTL